ncbi:uroporphyrinogen-III synthase [Mesorhizobium albiziae]|uniref:Uroporphyrinogen-III synthase n=1 Tax=Neomesorhizobium albiziae TaxID=335020 RepID=A0A1I3XZ69_9HYPH|nr:uroporphyrinogen-III synthase [Mesorhizobium albiziae]GLS30221.1 uroporphyrinogen III methyltransferase [Mesorhizobium albiziae]SFK24864.1 uroporphyrinogen-III synthase [Mesorhizobium albiziae]
MNGRVLVTRPQPGASRTALRLAKAGFEPVVLPLTEIRPIVAEPVSTAVDAIAVTSANAIRSASAALIAPLTEKPLFAVGPRTAKVADKAGFKRIVEADGDAAGLAAKMAARLRPGTRVLYLCGKVRRPDFEASAADAGLLLEVLETYDTVEIAHPAELADATLRADPIDAALVLSARAAELIASRVRPGPLAHLFEDTRYFCMSSRVAAALTGIDPSHIYIAERPEEDALIALLARES